MKKFIKRLILFLYFKLKYKGNLKIGYNVIITKKSRFFGINRLYDDVSFSGVMRGGCYIGPGSIIDADLGKYCSIGPDVSTLIGTHPLNYVSTSPVFFSVAKQAGYTFSQKQRFDEFIYADKQNKYGVIIGHDVWIGSGAKIIGGITIGNGAVILANAVVTKDVPPFGIVGGVPAKLIKYRFEQNQIDFLLNFKWWDKDENWIKDNLDLFCNIDEFIKANKI